MSVVTTHIKNKKQVVPVLRFKEFDGDWEIHSLRSLLDSLVDCEHKTAPYVDESEYLVVRTNNVKNGRLVYNDIKYTTEEGFKEWTKRSVPKYGDIFFTREAPAGESCLVPKDKQVCLGQRMVLLKSDENKITGQYLSSYLQSGSAIRDISNLSIGTTVTRINIADIYKLKCPVSSLPEQQKIASFLSAVDEKIQQLIKKKALLEQYKKGVMQQLFSGQLRFKDENGVAYPEWEEKRLGEFLKYYDGTHQTPKYVEEGVPFYSVEHVTANQFLKTKFISEEVFKKENKRVKLEKGDILMTRIGDIGTSRIIDWEVRASFYVSIALLKQNSSFNSSYLNQYISSVPFQKELWARTIHVAFPKKINLGEIGNCKTQLPSLEEQQKIADYLTSIDIKIESVNNQITQAQRFKKGLLQQMFV